MTRTATSAFMADVMLITLDNPPVNALSNALRRDLHEELQRAFEDAAVRAIVLICAGRTFVAGADITEFGQPWQRPSLPDLCTFLDDAPKPVIAAIHGTALGGGFELALACHYRIAALSAKVGLPEVHLGILPGAGGTQRVPRIVGVEAALEIITSGRRIGATEALSLGLIDAAVGDAILRDEAIAFAKRVIADGGAMPRIRDRTVTVEAAHARSDLFANFRKANPHRFKGFLAPAAIVEAVEAAVTLPFDDGLATETALFERLVASPESAAQRHAFFAEREAARVPDIGADAVPIDICAVGVIGAGTMGGGITMNFLNAGIPVTLVEMTQEALDRGIATIRRNYEATAAKGRMTTQHVEQRMALISPSLDLGALVDADLLIEAVYESMDVKRDIFARLDGIVKQGAILASNTSFLDLNRIAAATRRPACVVGLHFFSPANVMRLLEVVRGSATSKTVIATAMKLAKRIGKVAVLSGVCDGFIANRLLAPRGYQAEAMMLEGTPIAEIDRALVGYGFAMGHFQMMDLVGLDVIGRDAAKRTVMGDLVAAGRLGQKRGAGYYDYDEKRRPSPSAVTAALIAEVAAAGGVAGAATRGDEALLARLLYPVVNEGAKILDEGIALRASDIDIAAVLGYNWPVYRGGPLFWADQVGLGRVVAEMRALEAVHGEVFRPAPLLVRLADEGRGFGSLS
ncbi:3-hydroxyacyl-CoA dehydrogenase NAD-binding domain-containing protein [Sphingomonas sanxanigenens]|uniref:3-hydroxyacyl-CoA dehydrogenase n=1 Tax=Sphingomonas sanxanigenens DSM 19645 = NX02 TaxID=1123269 RepID=W0A4Z8_9SPHN|nr:3-hydroxyacyl-CoA dehydrogenase NAD-binding domain-containing protein [Sphingomonas sanxanigenens]AHE53009.1 3-hydroxyacyl-CoA dehydrogenase [Sphingomonas sanxanigenens DSM 19645 = NX02]